MNLAWNDLELTAEAALAAELVPWVGSEAELTRYDPVASPNVRIPYAALGLEAVAPGGVEVAVRVEEGVIHAGGLESAEAHLGWFHPHGWLGISLGRDDLPVSYDRAREPEDLTSTLRPVVARAFLPAHANGATAQLAWPNRMGLWGGVAWANGPADAPWAWARLEVHPWGRLPEAQDAPDSVGGALGAGVALLDSEGLGRQEVLAGDLSLRVRSFGLDLAAVRHRSEDAAHLELWAEAGGRVAPLPVGDLHLSVRGTRLSGLVDGEDTRWVAAPRLAWRSDAYRVEAWVQGQLSREVGTGVAPGEDVVGLPGGAERANDLVAAGLSARL